MRRLRDFLFAAITCFTVHAIVLLQLPAVQLVKYSHAAELLRNGKLRGERILDFSPLYLKLNALFQSWNMGAPFLLWFHIVCTSLAAGLLFLILRRYFRPWIAVAGVAAFILDRSVMVYTHTFEPEPLVLLLILAASYFAVLQTNPAALAGGLCFGLGILTRPNFVPVLLAIPLYYKLNSPGGSGWKRKTVLFLVPALLCLVGLWTRNASIVGYFSPFVMNPGTALYEGNNPNSWGMSSVYPPILNQLSAQHRREPDYHHQLYRDFARKIAGKQLTLPEVNSYWTAKASNFLLDHPARTLRLIAAKILHFFHSFQWHDLAVAHSTEQSLKQSWVLNTPFAILASLAILGLLLRASEWRRYFIFYAVFFSQFLFMMSIYVSARQRTSILFLFVFFACAAVDSILSKKKLKWLFLFFALLLSIPLHVKTDLMLEEEHLWRGIRQSNGRLGESYRLRNQGKLKEAAAHSAHALALAPWLIDSRRPANLAYGELGQLEASLSFSRPVNPAQSMDRAVLLLEAGRIQEAERIFRELQESGYRLKRDDYQSSELAFYLARCAIRADQQNKAVTLLEQAIEDSPGDPSSLAYLKALTNRQEFETLLIRYFDEIDAAFYLGQAHLETGNPQKAVRYFQYVTAMLPEFRKGYLYLAAALAESNLYEQASVQYRKAIALSPDPVFFEESILRTFKELTLHKSTMLNHYSYGIVLRQFGHFREALEEQKKAMELDPKNQEIPQEIERLQKVLAVVPNQ